MELPSQKRGEEAGTVRCVRRSTVTGVAAPFRGRRFVIVDVETTGLDPTADEIIELGLVLVEITLAGPARLNVVDEYVGRREPRRAISPQAQRVHGLRMDEVAGHHLDDARVRRLMTHAEWLVAHNAAFDRRFVSRLYPEAAARPWLCTMRQINWTAWGFPSRRLADVARGLHVDRGILPHRALADCHLTRAVLEASAPDGRPIWQHLLAGWRPRRRPGAVDSVSARAAARSGRTGPGTP